MPAATDIIPITGFTRGYMKVCRELRRHGRPAVLTVDGKAALVVQDAAAYDRMIDLLDAMYVDHEAAKGLADERSRLSVAQLRKKLTARRKRVAGAGKVERS